MTRTHLTAILVVAFLVVFVTPPAASAQDGTGHTAVEQQIAWETFTWINAEREARGVPPVAWSVEHAAGAAEWSRWMADNEAQVHAPSEDQHVDGFNAWGENIFRLAWQQGLPAGRAHVGFMASDPHRDNILGASWDVVGVGVACVDGYLHVTQRFGNHQSSPWEGSQQTPPDPVVHDDDTAGTSCLDDVTDPPYPSPVWTDDGPVDAPVQPDSGTDGPTTGRVADVDPVARAVHVARVRWPVAKDRTAGPEPGHVVLARSDEVADSLAASVLTGDGPLLLTGRDDLDATVAGELDRLLPDGGRVYLMGGEAALSARVEMAVAARGLTPVRVAGPTRTATAIAAAGVSAELYGPRTVVMVARAYGAGDDPTSGWADAIAGGLLAAEFRVPILLTATDQLDPSVANWLTDHGVVEAMVLGGDAAVSPEVLQAVGAHVEYIHRLGGPSRDATARLVNGVVPDDMYGDLLVSYDGYSAGGWVDGLLAAGVAADDDGRTVMLAPDRVPDRSFHMVVERGCGRHVAIGATVAAEVLEQVEAAC